MGRSPRRRGSARPEPLRASAMWRVDQVFLAHVGGRVEVTASLVNERGGDIRNLSVTVPTADPREAVEAAARFVAGKGNVSGARGARVRWARAQAASEQENLVRDHELEDAFEDAFLETLQEIRDQMR